MSNGRRHRRRLQSSKTERQANLIAALLVSKASGCTCRPDLEHRHRDGIANITATHDDWCPMAGHSSQYLVRPRRADR